MFISGKLLKKKAKQFFDKLVFFYYVINYVPYLDKPD